MQNVNELMEHTFRHEYGRLVAMLTRKMGIGQLEEIEDAVQSALLKAMHTWSRQGLPEDPPAWLYRTANNALLDRLRRARTWKEIHEQLQYQQVTEQAASLPSADSLDDDQLRMLFVSCHPAIGVEAQITFALKTLCGFSATEIAHALLTNEATILKRLTRAKDKLREEALDPDAITTSDLQQRFPISAKRQSG
jgi:RNA polymerase sigma factor (sigma-70 family)